MREQSRGPYCVDLMCPVRFTSPVRVGTGERLSLLTDAPLLRDAQGRPWIPGSSVRGALREWAEREAPLLRIPGIAVKQLFGVAAPRAAERDPDDRTPKDRQGRLTVFDLHLEGDATARVRDHAVINPARGSAKKSGKFDEEVADVGRATLRFRYEGRSPDDAELCLLRAAVAALASGQIPLGGKTGWGFGRIAADQGTTRGVDRRDSAGLAVYLRSRLPSGTPMPVLHADVPAPAATGRTREAGEPEALDWARLVVDLQFDGPMLVADPLGHARIPSAYGHADAVFQVDRHGQPILPGSSLRGVLRAYARRICTAVAAASGAGEPPVCTLLFGEAKGDGHAQRGRRGLLSVGEGALNGHAQYVALNHVAIDRLTGFAVDGRLFSSAALASPCFRTEITLRWRSARVDECHAVGALLMVLRDMGQGLLWAGSRTTRGYGRIAGVSRIAAAVSRVVRDDATGALSRGPEIAVDTGRVEELAAVFAPELDAWRRLTLAKAGA